MHDGLIDSLGWCRRLEVSADALWESFTNNWFLWCV